MTALIVQSALLIAIAFIVGAIAGCLARKAFGAAGNEDGGTIVATYGLAGPGTPAPAAPPPRPQAQPATAPEPASAKAPAAPARERESEATPEPGAGPAAEPPAEPAPPAGGGPAPDDLKRIRGIGPQNEARLHAAGITTFAQIAGWSRKDQAAWGERLAFPGRIEREEWVKQARALARGQETASSGRSASRKAASPADQSAGGAAPEGKPRLLKGPRRGKADDLTRIGGIGKAIRNKLHETGVYHYDQVAKWSDEEAAWISRAIGFPGRVEREGWREEAARLAAQPSGSPRSAGGAAARRRKPKGK
ncbi:hypothetical protein ACLB6G_07285 [Zhengella sp. ZM62]|uniref:hypothetical protein n=1 Tax=Zhengella sedimenti TaxID=3390035 RepID=UPI003975CDA5